MVSDQCGSSLVVALPEDALTVVNQFLSPEDVCNLGSCCRTLYGLASSDDIWMTQCQKTGILLHKDLVKWRKGFASYNALFRFLFNVQPLMGIWVHQNPELGNVVYVMPGYLSVVGCRIIPQELGPLGMEGSPILWAPVFEIIGDFDGSAAFFLHGREGDVDYLYPGLFKAADRTCNVLMLEVEVRRLCNVVKLVLVGTKILEGSRYAGHAIGSTIFTVNSDGEVSGQAFPWDADVVVLDIFRGEGIASGYGFRYPGSKPGSLFVIEGGLLAFVWEESDPTKEHIHIYLL